MNASNGSMTNAIITADNTSVVNASKYDITEANIIICNTIPSKLLRILCLYGLMINCVKAKNVLVTSSKTS